MKSSLACCAAFVLLAVLAPAASAARDRTPPTVPANVRVVAVTEDTITISWTASKDNSGRIHAYVAGGVYHPGNSTTKTFTGLVPDYTRTFQVQAMDPSGNVSALSTPVTGTTAPDTTAPTMPANLRVTGTTISTVSLAWDRSSDRWSFSYDVLMDGQVREPAASTSTTLRTIAPGSTHTFQVRARDNSGNVSKLSNAVTVTLPASADTTPPSAPSDLTVEDLNDNCGSQILRWRASTDDTDPQSAIEYELYLDDRFWVLTPPGAIWSGQYTQPGTNTWTVVAVDRAGNRSGPSNAVTLTIVADQNLC